MHFIPEDIREFKLFRVLLVPHVHHPRHRNSHYYMAKLPYNHVRDICFYAVAVYLREVLFPRFKGEVKKDHLVGRKTEADSLFGKGRLIGSKGWFFYLMGQLRRNNKSATDTGY